MIEFMGQVYGYAYRAVCSIPDGWPFKLAGGAVLLVLARHAMLFTAFTALVAIDLFAKFIALSYEMLKAQKKENPSLVESIKAIPENMLRIFWLDGKGGINSGMVANDFSGDTIVVIRYPAF